MQIQIIQKQSLNNSRTA